MCLHPPPNMLSMYNNALKAVEGSLCLPCMPTIDFKSLLQVVMPSVCRWAWGVQAAPWLGKPMVHTCGAYLERGLTLTNMLPNAALQRAWVDFLIVQLQLQWPAWLRGMTWQVYGCRGMTWQPSDLLARRWLDHALQWFQWSLLHLAL